MPRLKIEVASKYYKPLPRRVNLLNAERFLAVIRLTRSGNRVNFYDAATKRSGAYGFTPREWKRATGPWAHRTEGEAVDHLAYRWFIHCWHECLIQGFRDTAYNVAVFWQAGDRLAPGKIRKGKRLRWPDHVSRLYHRKHAV